MTRSHQQIIGEAGGVAIVRKSLLAQGIEIPGPTVGSWATRSSIPAEYWAAVAELGMATLDELAAAVDKRQALDDMAVANG